MGQSELWEAVKACATVTHKSPVVAEARASAVWNGKPYTGVGATSLWALTDLYERIKGDIDGQ